MTGRGGDTIELKGLRAMVICGALPEERERRQPVEVDVEVEVDLAAAGQSDALEDTVDYARLLAEIELVLTKERFTLLERLAQRVCDVLLIDERVCVATVAVHKLRPPVPQQVDTTGVRITRSRS